MCKENRLYRLAVFVLRPLFEKIAGELSSPFELNFFVHYCPPLFVISRSFEDFEDIILDPDSHIVTKGGRTLHLTLREFELLEMFMSKPRQVFTRQQILQQLWGWSDDLETNVVEVYICALRNKLDDENRSLLRTVRGVGYALG